MKPKPLMVWPNAKQRMRDFDPGDTWGCKDKREAQDKLAQDVEALRELQNVLSAQAEHAVLIIFQGMDTAGKDSAIKHVISGVNPQGVHVYSFKAPSEEEKRHDYLWRAQKVMPERGRIGIFNRSYYEDVLITRVHPDLLGPRLARHADKEFWKRRFRDINDYERYLADNGTSIIKFFLNISKKEQRKRLLERLDKPDKQWKFSIGDLQQRGFWDEYMKAYEAMVHETSTAHAPWYVIPADHKWFAHLAVADILVKRLRALKMSYPKLPPSLRDALREQKRKLLKG